MKNLNSYLFLFFVWTTLCCIPNHINGQESVGLYEESIAKSLLAKGIIIEGYSRVDEPQNHGYLVSYKKVLRIEKVATQSGGGKPWYYLVYFGPTIPKDGWEWWPDGQNAPWLTNSSSWLGIGVWEGKWKNTVVNREGESYFTVSNNSQNNKVEIHFTSWTTDGKQKWNNGSGVTRFGTLSGNTVSIPVKNTQLSYQFILDSNTKARYINKVLHNNKYITVTHILERK